MCFPSLFITLISLQDTCTAWHYAKSSIELGLLVIYICSNLYGLFLVHEI